MLKQAILLLFVADKKSVVADALGALRSKLGKDHGLNRRIKIQFPMGDRLAII